MRVTRKGFISHHAVVREERTNKVLSIRDSSAPERKADREYNRRNTNLRSWRGGK